MKAELGAEIETDAFEHEAIYCTTRHRIEMHLRAQKFPREQTFDRSLRLVYACVQYAVRSVR